MIRFQGDHDLNLKLSRTHRFPVEVDDNGPIPARVSYDPLHHTVANGFNVSVKDLLHAIGCKNAGLPMHKADEALASAYYFVHLLDLDQVPLCFLPRDESDLQTNRSMELGIGMMCLFARCHWSIPWDQLEPIPGPGSRFDYRGRTAALEAIFESRGTKYRNTQSSQIEGGLAKKKAHHERNERFDVELIVSTHVGLQGTTPRILIADPEMSVGDRAFGAVPDDFFRYRHYARVMQYIGATATARRLYLESNRFLGRSVGHVQSEDAFNGMTVVEIDRLRFIGRWHDSWVPKGSKRYSHLLDLQRRLPFGRMRVFQGLLEDFFKTIISSDPSQVRHLPSSVLTETYGRNQLTNYSLFDDGSILMIEPAVQTTASRRSSKKRSTLDWRRKGF